MGLPGLSLLPSDMEVRPQSLWLRSPQGHLFPKDGLGVRRCSSPDRSWCLSPWVTAHPFPPPPSGMEIRPWSIVSVLGVVLGHLENNSLDWPMLGRLLSSQNSLPMCVTSGERAGSISCFLFPTTPQNCLSFTADKDRPCPRLSGAVCRAVQSSPRALNPPLQSGCFPIPASLAGEQDPELVWSIKGSRCCLMR